MLHVFKIVILTGLHFILARCLIPDLSVQTPGNTLLIIRITAAINMYILTTQASLLKMPHITAYVVQKYREIHKAFPPKPTPSRALLKIDIYFSIWGNRLHKTLSIKYNSMLVLVDKRLIERKRQNTLDMCRIFTAETKKLDSTLTDKQNNRRRSKRETKVEPTEGEEEVARRVQGIVDKLYEDLEEKGEHVIYTQIKFDSSTTLPETTTNKTMRRFNFAPAELLGPQPTTENINKLNNEAIEGIDWPKRWKHGIVPYFIDSKTYDTQLSEVIMKAFDYFEKATCIRLQRLKDRPTDRESLENVEWLYITNPSGIRQCVHTNERKTNKGVQMVVFGYDCMSIGEIIHEVMHILGFSHEHTRPDRDRFVTILWNNIKPGYKKYFETRPTDALLNIPYDYASVLHYPSRAFSKNGQLTIMSMPGVRLGQREGLSDGDVEKVGIVYGSECVDRNRQYLLKTCPSVVKVDTKPSSVPNEEITEYFNDRLWPYGVVNYKLKDRMEFSAEERANIKAVMRHIEKETCIEFRDITADNDEEIPEDIVASDAGQQPAFESDIDEQTRPAFSTQNNEDESVSQEIDNNKNDNGNTEETGPSDTEKYVNHPSEKEKPSVQQPEAGSSETVAGEQILNSDVNSPASSEGNGENKLQNSSSENKNNKLYLIFPYNRTAYYGPKKLTGNTKDTATTGSSSLKRSDAENEIRPTGSFENRNANIVIFQNDTKLRKGNQKKISKTTSKRTRPVKNRKNNNRKPRRRHAADILVLARSVEPGCACPTPGKPGGNKILYINSDCFNSVNDLLHLFVHVLGLDHQHNMHDRDSYLHILWDNITSDIKKELEVKLPPAASLGFDYDYQSVMHYPWLQIKNGVTSIMYPIWNDGWAMGHWQGLSATDVLKLNQLYNNQCLERKQTRKAA